MNSQSQFLKVTIEAAKKAEEVILKHYLGEVKYGLKSDQSPVTIADTEAEEIIIKTIKEAFPNHSFLGEESGPQASNSEYKWVIDPIDGTKNYSRHIPLFSTEIALLKNGEIILGVSNAPILKELIYAEKNQGAYLNHKKLEVSNISTLKQAYLCFGGINHFAKTNKLNNLLELSENTMGKRGIGDFWCYHLLAQGKIDIMIEAKTKLWDFAALKIIIEEAGGKVTDIQGNPITPESTSVIASNKHLHEHVVGFFKTI